MPQPAGLHLPRQDREEAVANIRDAIQGYLASLEKHNEPVPPPIGEEVIEVPLG